MIEDRAYKKEELARLYSPFTKKTKSAMKKLCDDINGCPELVDGTYGLFRRLGRLIQTIPYPL